ncbi:hypothetical protein ACFP3Q_15545 [Nocardioides sp. GCM10027113]|uniref:hypothetical protein n=1 Tax=unclassified Nocardioides TaxID=2615069 RepID=UPI0036158DCE
MLAPLPRLYRWLVLAVLLLGSLGAGVWLAQTYTFPFGGLLIGSLAGLALGFAALHDFQRRGTARRHP